MTGAEIATWVSAAIAVVGTGITIWQTFQAKRAATKAVAMRDEIMKRNTQSEISSLSGTLKSAIRAMSKYGPGARPSVRRGYSPDNDAEAVRTLTTEMAELRVLLVKKFGNDVTAVIENINDLLDSFAAAANDEERVKHGLEIHNTLTELSGNIKHELDGGIYR